jgi:hypothetical protein
MQRLRFGLVATAVAGLACGLGVTAALAQSSNGSIAAIVARGEAVTCTVSRVAGNAQTQGALYVDSGKVRGDFTAQTPNGPIAST